MRESLRVAGEEAAVLTGVHREIGGSSRATYAVCLHHNVPKGHLALILGCTIFPEDKKADILCRFLCWSIIEARCKDTWNQVRLD